MSATDSPRLIPWHRRLETRVAVAISVLVAFSLGAVLLVTTRAVTMRALDNARSDLTAASSAFHHLVDDRAEFASAQAALVTALPVFRAHMTDTRLAADVDELTVLGEEYRGLMKADFCIVADRHASWSASPGWPAGLDPPASVSDCITSATTGQPRRAIAEIGERLFLVVSEPARFGEEVLGTLTAGFELNDAIARRLAQETGCEVNLLVGGRLTASSLSGADRAALAARAAAGDRQLVPGAPTAVDRVGQGEYAIGAAVAPGQPATIVLLEDWVPTGTFIRRSQRVIFEIGLLVFAIALGAGWLFSRRISRPISDLAQAAGDIAGGNWSRQAAAGGGAETTMLAEAFNGMTTSLRHWYEEAKRRDDQFRQAQKMEAMGRLAGGVAHDFNNLLTAIKGYAQLLDEDLGEQDPRHDDVGEILKAADRAAELTRQLLTFSRREAVAMKTLSLIRIVRGTENMLERLIGEDITLSSTLPSDTWPVRGDTGQLEQVLVNLAVNARDAMDEGGTLRIELSNVMLGDEPVASRRPLPPGPYVQLAVSDTGCGMAQETAARIFEPFFTTKGEGRGTGLGLAMVYGVVEQSGGAIEVETALNKGTTFRIYLPAIVDGPVIDAVASTHTPTATAGSETILLVEDDRGVAMLLSRSLERAGYQVLVANHGEKALAILRSRERPIDLLLTDVIMPGMNGRELAEQVIAERPGTRVLFMSGYSNDAILKHGIATASVNFIQKPFAVGDLARKIREILT